MGLFSQAHLYLLHRLFFRVRGYSVRVFCFSHNCPGPYIRMDFSSTIFKGLVST